MTDSLADTCRGLAASLAGLKQRARDAVASELAAALGSAAKNLAAAAFAAPTRLRTQDRRHDDDGGRGDWGGPSDPWDDPEGLHGPARYEPAEVRAPTPAPHANGPGAVAVGLALGRWWLARRGGVLGALGVGALAAALGLVGGPLARAAMAVLAAAADLLAAESALARPD